MPAGNTIHPTGASRPSLREPDARAWLTTIAGGVVRLLVADDGGLTPTSLGAQYRGLRDKASHLSHARGLDLPTLVGRASAFREVLDAILHQEMIDEYHHIPADARHSVPEKKVPIVVPLSDWDIWHLAEAVDELDIGIAIAIHELGRGPKPPKALIATLPNDLRNRAHQVGQPEPVLHGMRDSHKKAV